MFDIHGFLISAILESSSKIESAISSIPDGSYFLATYSGVLSGISAFFAAWVLNYFTKKELSKKKKISKIANVAYKKSDDLENDAINYWLEEKGKFNQIDITNLEIKIKSTIINIQTILDELYTKDSLKQSDKLRLIELNGELYDCITGGEFEVLYRASSKSRAIKVATVLSEVKLILLRYDY
ncbi:hypothetical protein ACU5EH_17515 [Aliivibrio salmonicida]|uniref:hypothetical protein n=1 Tax=Aliivibrio salmonicida TaxID=40269 RepID=UPI00406CE20F